MAAFICETCGVQHAESEEPPASCPICEDARQYVGYDGQRWTTLEQLAAERRNVVRGEAGLTGVGTEPSFAIAQRALLVPGARGNALWDCTPLLGEETVAEIEALGGISAIAVSHPHFYSTAVEWSRAFGGAPVYLHAADRQWVMRPDPAIVHWEGDARELEPGITLVRCGGHFPGGTVLHAERAPGGGALLTGDVIAVASDRRWLTFMYSFPNRIPLSEQRVRRVVEAVEPYDFGRIYGGWWGDVTEDAKAALARSAERYMAAITGTFPPPDPSERA